jgi:hypothetical protein
MPRLGLSAGALASATAGATTVSPVGPWLRARVIAVLVPLLLCLAPPAFAYDPLAFVPEQVPAARLCGEATLRLYGKPVYAAKLFIDPGTFSPQDLTRESFALDFDYVEAVKASRLVRDFRSQMQDQGSASSAQIRRWGTQLGHFIPNIAAQQHLTAVFLPKRGTRFYLNGDELGEITGDDFARAFFGVWLDDTTTMPGMRQQLLHGAG